MLIDPKERFSFSFRHSYGLIRARFWQALDGGKYTMPMRTALRLARVGVVIVDLPMRWLMHFFDAMTGDRGYLTVGSIIGGYLIVFGLIDAKHQQEETRASFERSQFTTLVSAANAATFAAALMDFGKVQTMRATAHPELSRPWKWGQTWQPNLGPLRSWAVAQFESCVKETCSTNNSRIDLRGSDLAGADLTRANLSDADLTGADLDNANLTEAKLLAASLHLAKLTRANLRGAALIGADLTAADLNHAYLQSADLSSTNLRDALLSGAEYDDKTLFPEGFKPGEHWMVRQN